MKILVLNGSPRVKSNTMTITNEFLAGYKEADPSVEIEVIDLRKMSIHPCKGCFGCWIKTPGRCVFDDDMSNIILPKLMEANLVIWSFPLYCFALPAEATACLNRLLPTNLPYIEPGGTGHPPRYERSGNIRFMVISTCGFCDASIYKAVDYIFERMFNEFDSIYRTMGETFNIEGVDPLIAAPLAAIRQCGRDYAKDGKFSEEAYKEATRPLMDVDAFTTMANSHWDQMLAKLENPDLETEPAKLTPAMMVAFFPTLYNKAAYTRDIECQITFTDVNEVYTFCATKEKLESRSGPGTKPDVEIKVTFEDWMAIAEGKVQGQDLVMEGRMAVKGGLENLMGFFSLLSKK